MCDKRHLRPDLTDALYPVRNRGHEATPTRDQVVWTVAVSTQRASTLSAARCSSATCSSTSSVLWLTRLRMPCEQPWPKNAAPLCADVQS